MQGGAPRAAVLSSSRDAETAGPQARGSGKALDLSELLGISQPHLLPLAACLCEYCFLCLPSSSFPSLLISLTHQTNSAHLSKVNIKNSCTQKTSLTATLVDESSPFSPSHVALRTRTASGHRAHCAVCLTELPILQETIWEQDPLHLCDRSTNTVPGT